MRKSNILLSILPLLATFIQPIIAQLGCPSVHIIAARATGEPPGEGIVSQLVETVKTLIPGTTDEALDYPASLPYSGSLPMGVQNMKQAIAKFSSKCPQTKLALMGYSQGGAVVVDTLCGGGGPQVGPSTPGLSPLEGANVQVAISFGDPRFVPGTSYEAGTNQITGGIIERSPIVAQCPQFAQRIVSFCDFDDSRCASGDSLLVHVTYLDRYLTQAAQMTVQKLRAP